MPLILDPSGGFKEISLFLAKGVYIPGLKHQTLELYFLRLEG